MSDTSGDKAEASPHPNPYHDIAMQLGLGQHWFPGPAAWDVVEGMGENGKIFILVFSIGSGKFGVMFDPDSFQRLGSSIIEKAGKGLVVAPSHALAQLRAPNPARIRG